MTQENTNQPETTLQRVLGLLDNVTGGTNGNYTARCPAHDDNRSSLSVSEGDDGRVLLFCHAGCEADAIVDALGLSMADLFPKAGTFDDPRPAKKTPKRTGKLYPSRRDALAALDAVMAKTGSVRVAKHVYRDRAREEIALVVRYDHAVQNGQKPSKEFRPLSRHDGGWKIADPPNPWPLYGAVGDAPGRVFVPEGEKCADLLNELGLTAVTSAHGAKSSSKSDWTPLAGHEVVILPDNDDPGRKYAENVAGIVAGLEPPATVKIVNLDFPERKEHDDVVEFVAYHRGQGLTDAEIRQQIEAAAAAPVVDPQTLSAAEQKDNQPKIEISTEEEKVNTKAIKALAADPAVYQRGGMLVRLMRDTSPATKGVRRPNTPRIAAFPRSVIQERLAAAARWVRVKTTPLGNVEIPAHPEGWSVSAIFEYGAWPGIRYLESVIDHPVLKPDGTVLDTPGYDASTGLLLSPIGGLPTIPKSPSLSDAKAARDLLLDVVCDFPFVNDAHRAAWLAGLLTPLGRFAFHGPTPIFVSDANSPGAGKGKLLHVIAHILNGQDMTVATFTKDEDELRKRITSIAMNGDRLVLFDNLVGTFGGAVLCAALTASSWKDRILGGNRLCDVPLFASWYGTGNNVTYGQDMPRRVCHIRLESKHERPDRRDDFKHKELLDYVHENRHELLAAALTILRAYCVAGRPKLDLRAWGSFTGWSSIIRSAVVWCGMCDPIDTQELLRERSDTTTEGLAILLQGWQQMDPEGRGMTASYVIEQLYSRDHGLTAHAKPGEDMVQTAIEMLCGKPDVRSLGNTLRAYQRRIVAGLYMDHAGSDKRAIIWKVFPAEAFSTEPNQGESGESGESVSTQRPTGSENDGGSGPILGGQGESGESGESVSTAAPSDSAIESDAGNGPDQNSTAIQLKVTHQTHQTHPTAADPDSEDVERI